jgi:hypothetical protein
MKDLKDTKDKSKEDLKEENKEVVKQPVVPLIPNINFFMPKPIYSPLQFPSHEASFNFSQEKNVEQNLDKQIRRLVYNNIEVSQDNTDSVFANWERQRGSFNKMSMESFNVPLGPSSFVVLEEAIGSFSFSPQLKLVSEHDSPPQQKADDKKQAGK